jgi:hypothetical protein
VSQQSVPWLLITAADTPSGSQGLSTAVGTLSLWLPGKLQVPRLDHGLLANICCQMKTKSAWRSVLCHVGSPDLQPKCPLQAVRIADCQPYSGPPLQIWGRGRGVKGDCPHEEPSLSCWSPCSSELTSRCRPDTGWQVPSLDCIATSCKELWCPLLGWSALPEEDIICCLITRGTGAQARASEESEWTHCVHDAVSIGGVRQRCEGK